MTFIGEIVFSPLLLSVLLTYHCSSFLLSTCFPTSAALATLSVSIEPEETSPLRDRPVIFFNRSATVVLNGMWNDWQEQNVLLELSFTPSWLVLPSLFLSVVCFITIRYLTITPKPSSISSQNRECQPGATQPVQQRQTKEPSTQSQRTHTR